MKIFVDDSRSMEIFDRGVAGRLRDALEKEFPVSVVGTAETEKSPIGDFLLRNMQQNDNIFLISDGQVNDGKELGDIMLLAYKLNASISSVKLNQVENDAYVTMVAPELSSAGTDTPILVRVKKVGTVPQFELSVLVDGAEWIKQAVTFDNKGEYSLELARKLPEGSHQIVASITATDHFKENNIFRKVIKVEPKPKIAFVSSSFTPPILNLLNPLFEITATPSLPTDLTPYSAVVLDNLKASNLPSVTRLSEFVSDGKGLFLIGGPSSLDRGDFKGNQIENILPVNVGTPKKDKNNTPNIIILIDISDSSGASFSTSSQSIVSDIQEDIAIGIIRGMTNETKIGVMAFNVKAYEIFQLKEKKFHGDMEGNITRLVPKGGTLIEEGIFAALRVLAPVSGSKNIILISDGVSHYPTQTLRAANAAAASNVKIFTVGVGQHTDEVSMKKIASITSGSYYQAQERDRVAIVLGQAEPDKNASNSLVVVDFNDFITKDLDLYGKITGFNSVIPKSSAKVLVTLTDGRPILSTWRFGLGRVAVLSTDDGSGWASALLNKDNAPLLSKTIFWTVGDPRAAKEFDVLTTEGFSNEPIDILVKSKEVPQETEVSFSKIDDQLYSATVVPEAPGFFKVLNAPIAVNYPKELTELGVSSEFEELIQYSGGKIFEETQIQEIIDAVKQHSERTEVKSISWAWIPLTIGLLLFLIEVILRRVADSRH